MKRNNIVAIYSRLSAEDRDKMNQDDESRSIQNQKSMLISYAQRQGWEIYQIYSDDDYQGSDRTRPAFNQLLKDARAGKFGIVLCKSQSRFTRELELVEKILHGDFVEWGIRFVGYADNADTSNKGNKKARQINGLVNEWYLEDLSESIRTVLTDHREKGMHIGSFALYGYMKDPGKKGHLLIDPEAAAVVREIFEMYAAGIGKLNIARILNARGIPNAMEYKRQKGLKYGGGATLSNSGLWKYSAVSSVLGNEMYIGNMVQGKYAHASYKSKHSKPVPRQQWIRVEGTHEPIIDRELWDRVQATLKTRARAMCDGQIGLFACKVRCMYCGYAMHSVKNRQYRYLRCSQKAVGAHCRGSFIPQRLLENAVLKELHNIINLYLDEEKAESYICLQLNHDKRKRLLQKELQQLQTDDLRHAIRQLYLDKVKGIITEEEFLFLKTDFEHQIRAKEERANSIQKELEHLQEVMGGNRQKLDVLREYQSIDHLDRIVVDTLIDYIEVGHLDKKEHKYDLPPIKIFWKF